MLWNRSLDAHAEKIDHGLVRMYIRFRIKVHRKLSEPARIFNRAALKSDENRDLLNQAYISARDEYDQQFPTLPQSNASRRRTSVQRRFLKIKLWTPALGPRSLPLAPRTNTRTALSDPPSPRFHPISARFHHQKQAYLGSRKTRFRNIPTTAQGKSGIPLAPQNLTRTVSTDTPTGRPPLISEPHSSSALRILSAESEIFVPEKDRAVPDPFCANHFY